MAHGYSILEMTKFYEKRAKNLKKITADILNNKSEYYGVLSISDSFDLLIGLIKSETDNIIYASIWRGFPKKNQAADHEINLYLSQALLMFPEIQDVKFIKGNWPEPYNAKQ